MSFDRRMVLGGLAAAGGLSVAGGAPGRAVAAQTPTPTPTRTQPDYAGPWMPLFNGRNLDGWSYYQTTQGTTDKFNTAVVEDGVIHILGPKHTGGDRPGIGYLATVKEYGNYHLKVDYKFGERRYEPRLLHKRNSGLLIHTYAQDKIWPNTVEVQLEETDAGDLGLMNTWCWPGGDLGGTPAWPNNSLSERVPPPRGPNHPPVDRQRVKKNGDFERPMDWNTVEVIAVADKLAVLVNGRIVSSAYELQMQDVTDRDVYFPLTKGRICLEIELAEVMFRNVQIRMLA